MQKTKISVPSRLPVLAAAALVTFGAWPTPEAEAAPKRSTRTYKRKTSRKKRAKKRRAVRARRFPRLEMPKQAFPVMAAPRPLAIDAIPAKPPVVMHPDRAPGDPKHIMRVGSRTKVIQFGVPETPTQKPAIIDTSKPPEMEKAASEGVAPVEPAKN